MRLPLTVCGMIAVLMMAVPGTAEADEVIVAEDVFVADRDSHWYRIPSLVVATDGSLLAFAHRTTDGPHGGATTIVARRSADGGRTWQPIQELESGESRDELQVGAAIVDQNSGDVLLFVEPRYHAAEHVWRSDDHGRTWQKEPVEVRPNSLGQKGATHGSESGITLRHGEHAGRLLMPARARDQNLAIYSDDGGRTWQTSEPVQEGTGEGTLVELSDGTIYYNSRSHTSTDSMRRIAYSHDGGESFEDFRNCDFLYEAGDSSGRNFHYGCNAGLVRVPSKVTGDDHDVLLFSTPDSKGGMRVALTVWASFDGGDTWRHKRLVFDGPSAYSSLAVDHEQGTVYLLFERGGPPYADARTAYEGMAVARIDMQWLAHGRDWRELLPDPQP